MDYVCPICQNEEHPDGAIFCQICGAPVQIEALTVMEMKA